MLTAAAYMVAFDSRYCFLRWAASPACGRLLGVSHPVAQRLGVYLFLPFGLGYRPAGRTSA